jgi:hypothetical protein
VAPLTADRNHTLFHDRKFCGQRTCAQLHRQLKAMMGTILAYITFAGAMGGALYLLANDKPLDGLAALVTALGAAFGPKIYADFIQPKANAPAHAQNH